MRLLLVVLLTLSIASCSQPLDPQSASIVGFVVESPSGNAPARFLVGGHIVEAEGAGVSEYFSASIGGPVFLQTHHGEFVPALPSALRKGAPVRIWSDGVNRESIPAQVTAIRIVVEPHEPELFCRAVGRRPSFERVGGEAWLSC